MPEKPQPRKTGKLTIYLGSEVSRGFCVWVASESSSYPTPTRSLASSPVLEVYKKGVTYQWLGEDATWVVHKKKWESVTRSRQRPILFLDLRIIYI